MTDQLWQPHEPVHLTTMWVELEKYQPYADKHGFGGAWQTMCEERTSRAAEDAADAAYLILDAADAAWNVVMATQKTGVKWSQYAIRLIRRAIAQEQT